jgi:hypothetical protein
LTVGILFMTGGGGQGTNSLHFAFATCKRLCFAQRLFAGELVRPEPAPRYVIPIVEPTRPAVRKPDFKAAALRHGFVFDQSNWHPGILPAGDARGNGQCGARNWESEQNGAAAGSGVCSAGNRRRGPAPAPFSTDGSSANSPHAGAIPLTVAAGRQIINPLGIGKRRGYCVSGVRKIREI